MDIQGYLEKMKTIQSDLLIFLDKEENVEEYFQNLQNNINDLKNGNDPHKIKTTFKLLLNFANHHHRFPNFFSKLDKIFLLFKNEIRNFSNSELFNFFRSNKRILLLLIEEKIITIDEYVLSQMKTGKYSEYFTPEINSKKSNELPENFYEKRKNGENESKVCELIRKDSIDEFITLVNKDFLSLNATVNSSIYETNSILRKNKTSLIEYAAFFGSIQIFKYLYLNKVKLTPSLWIYSIHGNDPEIIRILEEQKIKPPKNSYKECLEEAIKCYNEDMFNYLQENYIQDNQDYLTKYFLKHYNFAYMKSDTINESLFYYYCKYDYYLLAENFLQNKSIDINEIKEERDGKKRSKDKETTNALCLAIENENVEIVKILLSRDDIDINFECVSYKYDTKNHIDYAKDWNDDPYDQKHEYIEESTALNEAARKGNVDIVRLLLSFDNVDVNKKSNFRDAYWDIWDKFIWGGEKGIQGLSVDNSDGRMILSYIIFNVIFFLSLFI